MSNFPDSFKLLSSMWTIERDGHFLPGAGPIPWGAIVPCYPTEHEALNVAKQLSDEYPDQFSNLKPRPVGDIWEAMFKAAGEGLCAFQSTSSDTLINRWPFVVRVEEAGSEKPTCIWAIRREGGIAGVLTKAGFRSANCAEFLPWRRFDVLDPVNASWGINSPFRNHENGEPLWEILPPGGVLTIQENNILNEYSTPEGVFAFFTSESEASNFLEDELRGSKYGIFSDQASSNKTPSDEKEIRISPVYDLESRIKELADVIFFGKFVVNPNGHRENTAWGWVEPKDWGSENFQKLTSKTKGCWIRSASGVWEVSSKNVFNFVGPAQYWNGVDTFYQTGGQEVQLSPLNRSVANVNHLPSIFEGVSEIDAEELLDDFLGNGDLESFLSNNLEYQDRNETPQEVFIIKAWDTVTGEHWETFSFFNVIEAISFLSTFEREHDRQTRTEGAHACFMLGFAGSNAPEWERDRSKRFQVGLTRIAKKIVRQGYKPDDSGNLVALCNSVLKTLHINYAGYVADLLISCSDTDKETLLEDIGLDYGLDLPEPGQFIIDPTGETIAQKEMGKDGWRFLSDKSRFFLSTALSDFQERGYAPQLDYAPLSVQVVKALEVETGSIFLEFWTMYQSNLAGLTSDIHEEKSLLLSLPKGSAPSLGEMARMFKNAKKAETVVSKLFAEFLKKIDDQGYLTSKKFCDKALSKALHKYRNGGAHDSAISYETCRNCIRDLVGENGRPGIIAAVAQIRSECL